MSTRACSPPERRPTGVSSCSGRNRKRLAQPTTWIVRPSRITESPNGARVRLSETSGSRRARCWSKVTTWRFGARSTVPASGGSSPAISRSSVVFPLPFAPRSPRRIPGDRTRSRSRMTARGPKLLVTPSADEQALGLAVRPREVDADAARLRPRVQVGQLLSQPPRRVDPRLGLSRAGLGLPRQPLQLAAHAVSQRLLVRGLCGQLLVLLLEVRAVAAAHVEDPLGERTVQLDEAPGDGLEKVAVVAHGHESLGLLLQALLQPEDPVDVEVVRGLVEEQELGLAHERAADGQPLLPAARQSRGGLRRVLEACLAHLDADAGLGLVIVETQRRDALHARPSPRSRPPRGPGPGPRVRS